MLVYIIMSNVKHYVVNQTLSMLYHSLINSRAQYRNIAWRRSASCHLHPVTVVLNRTNKCLNANELVTSNVATIYEMQKNHQLKDIYNLEVNRFFYKYANYNYLLHLTIILNSMQMFTRMTQNKLKCDNLLYLKDVQTKVLK